jgi:hypothetical protein
MKEQINHPAAAKGFDKSADHNELADDSARIEKYRAIALAEGLQQGSESQVEWAWQWLSDHPEITSHLQDWFAFRVAELKSMGRIK